MMLQRIALTGTSSPIQYPRTVLMLHGEGSSIIDSSLSPKSPAITGSTAISSAQRFTGSSSILIPNASSQLAFDLGANDALAGTENFTIQFFLYAMHSVASGNYYRYLTLTGGDAYPASGYREFTVRTGSSGRYEFFTLHGTNLTIIGSGVSAVLNAWTYHAITKSGSTFTWYLGTNGTTVSQICTLTNSNTINYKNLTIAPTYESGFGYYDECRIYKGAALSISGYPSLPFPDSP